MEQECNIYALPGIDYHPTDEEIFKSVCNVYNTDSSKLMEENNKREFTEPRQVIMFLIVVAGRRTMLYIENEYGKNHSTVNHSMGVVKNLYNTNKVFRQNFISIIDMMEINGQNREIILEFLTSSLKWQAFKCEKL